MRNNIDLKLAVLIDADNVPYSNVAGMLDEIAKFGRPTIKRIYGDWTHQRASGWKNPLLEHAITPIQQYSYTVGKNATDSAMIIDAMDILHSGKADGFCIVSSDSDFTRLATRLRESGMLVIGIGEKKTPKPFRVACDKFIYIEIINSSKLQNTAAADRKGDLSPKESSVLPNIDTVDDGLQELIKETIEDVADDNGWAFLGDVGNLINKKRTDFDPRNYGYPKLTPLIRSLPKYFEIDVRTVENKDIKHIYVRNK